MSAAPQSVCPSSFYGSQKKTLEINPRHPLIKELQRRVENEEQDETTIDLANVLYETAVLRSGYGLKDSGDFAGRIERMLRLSLGVDLKAPVSSVGHICHTQSLYRGGSTWWRLLTDIPRSRSVEAS